MMVVRSCSACAASLQASLAAFGAFALLEQYLEKYNIQESIFENHVTASEVLAQPNLLLSPLSHVLDTTLDNIACEIQEREPDIHPSSNDIRLLQVVASLKRIHILLLVDQITWEFLPATIRNLQHDDFLLWFKPQAASETIVTLSCRSLWHYHLCNFVNTERRTEVLECLNRQITHVYPEIQEFDVSIPFIDDVPNTNNRNAEGDAAGVFQDDDQSSDDMITSESDSVYEEHSSDDDAEYEMLVVSEDDSISDQSSELNDEPEIPEEETEAPTVSLSNAARIIAEHGMFSKITVDTTTENPVPFLQPTSLDVDALCAKCSLLDLAEIYAPTVFVIDNTSYHSRRLHQELSQNYNFRIAKTNITSWATHQLCWYVAIPLSALNDLSLSKEEFKNVFCEYFSSIIRREEFRALAAGQAAKRNEIVAFIHALVNELDPAIMQHLHVYGFSAGMKVHSKHTGIYQFSALLCSTLSLFGPTLRNKVNYDIAATISIPDHVPMLKRQFATEHLQHLRYYPLLGFHNSVNVAGHCTNSIFSFVNIYCPAQRLLGQYIKTCRIGYLLPFDEDSIEPIRKLLHKEYNALVATVNLIDQAVEKALILGGHLRLEYTFTHATGLLGGGLEYLIGQFCNAPAEHVVDIVSCNDLSRFVKARLHAHYRLLQQTVEKCLHAGATIGQRAIAATITDSIRYLLSGSTKYLGLLTRSNPVANELLVSQRQHNISSVSPQVVTDISERATLSEALNQHLQHSFMRVIRPKAVAAKFIAVSQTADTLRLAQLPVLSLTSLELVAKACVCAYVLKVCKNKLGMDSATFPASCARLSSRNLRRDGVQVTQKCYDASSKISKAFNLRLNTTGFNFSVIELLRKRIIEFGGEQQLHKAIEAVFRVNGVDTILSQDNSKFLLLDINEPRAVQPLVEQVEQVRTEPEQYNVNSIVRVSDFRPNDGLKGMPYADFQCRAMLRVLLNASRSNTLRLCNLDVGNFVGHIACGLVDPYHFTKLRSYQSIKDKIRTLFPAWDGRKKARNNFLTTNLHRSITNSRFANSVEDIESQAMIESDTRDLNKFMATLRNAQLDENEEYSAQSLTDIQDSLFQLTTQSHFTARPQFKRMWQSYDDSESSSEESDFGGALVPEFEQQQQQQQQHLQQQQQQFQQQQQQQQLQQECNYEGCRNIKFCRGLCKSHYMQRRRHHNYTKAKR